MRGKGEGEETERRVDEEEGLFNADTVNEEDSERDRRRERARAQYYNSHSGTAD